MKAAVLGAGAIGGWLAGALAEAGVQVGIVARGATLAALRSHGLRVSRDGTERVHRLPAGDGADLGPQDFVIIATKAQDVGAAVPQITAMLGPDTCVVSALNGMPWWFCQNFPGPLNNMTLESVDPGGRVAAAIEPRRAVGCVVHASVTRTAPGAVRISKIDKLLIGEPRGVRSERVARLCAAFSRAGIDTIASPQIRLETWAKLWGNMNMNPLSALTRATTGRMLDDPEIRALCLRMMEEMAAAGTAIGLTLAMPAADRIAITRKLGDFRTSMLQDLENGAALEFQPQLGAVVEVARAAGIAAPFCESVLGLIRQLSVSASTHSK